jgi:putative peptidoglycan lipid II flippase
VVSIGLVLQAYLAVVLNVRKWFVGSVCLGMAAHICGVLSGVIWGRQYGPIAIALGILAGTILAILSALWMARKDFYGFSQSGEGRSDLRRFIAIALPVALGSAAFTSLQVIDTFWAHRLNEGNLSQLAYAHRILVALGTLLIAAPSVLLTPTLVLASASGRHRVFRERLWDGIRSVALIGALLAVTICSLAEPLVELLFQHGQFLARDAEVVVTLIRIMLPGMVLMSVTVVLYRGLISHHRSGIGMFVGPILFFSYFVLSGVFISRLGVLGVAVAYSMSWLLTCLFTLAIIGLIARIKQNAVLLFDALCRLGAIGVVVFSTTNRAIFASLSWSSTLTAIVQLCVGCCVALAGIYILFFKSNKWKVLFGITWRKQQEAPRDVLDMDA